MNHDSSTYFRPRFAVLGRVGKTNFYKNTKFFPSVSLLYSVFDRSFLFTMWQFIFVFFMKAEQHPSIKVLRFDGSLYASNSSFFKRKLYDSVGIKLQQTPLIKSRKIKVETIENPIKYVVLDCAPFNFIDTVGVKLLIEVTSRAWWGYGEIKCL